MPYPDSEYPSILRGRDKRQSQRLLAAAPKLLAAVKEAYGYAQDTKERFIDHWDGEDQASYESLCDACEAGIAKAEGRDG
jgi:hypothetical protein